MSGYEYSPTAFNRDRGAVALGVGWGDGAYAGGDDRQHGGGASRLSAASAGNREPVAESTPTGDHSAAGPWPSWAVPQLQAAVQVLARAQARHDRTPRAITLYRDWYAPITARPADPALSSRPLAGLYRRAHAASAVHHRIDGVLITERHDVLGRDGWWRTWGPQWQPTRSRQRSARVLFTPNPDALADFVTTLTAWLHAARFGWLLACPSDPRGIRRAGFAVLHVPDADSVADLLPALRPMLADRRPPLALPMAPGVGLCVDPGNGMTFGEHRCHLIASALHRRQAQHNPLAAIAEMFATHDVDPAAPYRPIR